MRPLANPRPAGVLLRLVWIFRPRGWSPPPPFLPLPPREYIRWRMFTAYGDEAAVPPLEDVVRFARWHGRFVAVGGEHAPADVHRLRRRSGRAAARGRGAVRAAARPLRRRRQIGRAHV